MHHGALAYLLGIDALRASEAAAVRIEDYTLRGHRALHLVGKGTKPATPTTAIGLAVAWTGTAPTCSPPTSPA